MKNKEQDLQIACYEWFHNTYPDLRGLLMHVPNGELRHPVTGKRLKLMGVQAGAPDFQFFLGGFTFFCELKREGVRTVSKAQKAMHEQLHKQGFKVEVINNLTDFQKWIMTCINISHATS